MCEKKPLQSKLVKSVNHELGKILSLGTISVENFSDLHRETVVDDD